MRHLVTLIVLLLVAAGAAQADWEAGVAAFKAKNYSQAVTEFSAVVEEQPEYAGGHLMLGRSLLLSKQAGKAVPHLQRALELAPDDANTQLALGQALYQSGKYKECSQILGKLNVGSLPQGTQAAIYQMRGGAFQRSNEEDKALADFKKWAQLAASDGNAQYAYGAAALKAGDTQVAVSALEKAYRINGTDTKVVKTYVDALKRQGRLSQGATKDQSYQKAVGAAQKLVATDASFDNLLLLGEVEMGAKSYDSAVATLRKATAKKPNEWLPFYYIGQAQTAAGDFGNAEQPLQAALQKATKPDDQKKIWDQLGYVYEKQKKFDDSISAYQRAGNARGESRVAENKKIAEENKAADAHNAEIKRLQEERDKIREALQNTPTASPPPVP